MKVEGMFFPIVFEVEIWRKKMEGCAQDEWSATTKSGHKV